MALDLLIGYHWVEVRPKESVQNRVLYVQETLYLQRNAVVLFIALLTFHQLIKQFFGDKINVECLVYLVYVLLFAVEAEALFNTTREVLQLLIRVELKCKATRCSLYTERVTTWGTSSRQIASNPIRSESVEFSSRPNPSNVRNLHRS